MKKWLDLVSPLLNLACILASFYYVLKACHAATSGNYPEALFYVAFAIWLKS